MKSAFFLLIIFFCINCSQIFSSEKSIDISVITSKKEIKAEDSFIIGFRFDHAERWHTYWKNPGGPGFSPNIDWNLPKGWKASDILYTIPQKFITSTGDDVIINYGYKGVSYLFIKISTNSDTENQEKIVSGSMRYLVCNDENCFPKNFIFEMEIKVGSITVINDNWPNDKFDSANPVSLPTNYSNKAGSKHRIKIYFKYPKIVKKLDFFPESSDFINVNLPFSYFKNLDGQNIVQLSLIDELEVDKIDKIEGINFKGLIKIQTEDGDVKSYIIDPIQKNIKLEKVEEISTFLPSYIGDNIKKDIEKNDSFKKTKGITGSVKNISNPRLAKALSSFAQIKSENKTENKSLGLILIFAFLAGAILNLMPCVFPVISIKIMSFSKYGGLEKKKIVYHSLMYTFGILFSFWVLAIIFIIAKKLIPADGEGAIGWAFQFQNPYFVLFMAGLLFVIGLNFAGIFEIGTGIASTAGKIQNQTSNKNVYISSFMSGVLATAIATPCTGPYMGVAISYALSNDTLTLLLVFTALGLGLASPYVFLSAFPRLSSILPKPGAWMESFKKILSIPMFIVAFYLIWVLASLKNEPKFLIGSLVVLSILGFTAFIYGQVNHPLRKRSSKIFGNILCLLLIILSVFITIKSSKKDGIFWQEYTANALADALESDKAVFLDFTATWCTICNTNKLQFSNSEIIKKIKEKDIQLFKVDWTNQENEILNLLKYYGRQGVPLYVLYSSSKDKAPMILPNVLTKSNLLDAFEKL